MRTGKWKKLAALLVAVSAVGVGLIGAHAQAHPELQPRGPGHRRLHRLRPREADLQARRYTVRFRG